MLTSVIPPSCPQPQIHLRRSRSSPPESSPVARPVPQRWRPNCVASPRARIATCSHHRVVTPSGAGWLLVSIPGRSMCSPLLIISKGAPLPRGAAVDSRLMALPPTPSPHGPAFAIQCMSTWFTPSGAGWLLMSIPGRSMCSPLLILSKGAPLPRGAAVDSRLMALPPPPSPHSPDFAIQCIHPPPVSRRSMNEGEELEADLSKGPQLHSEGVRLFRSPEKKVPLSSGRCVGVISCPCSSLASHLYVSTSSRGVTLDKAPLPSILYVQCRRVSLLDSASPRISFALVR